MEELRLQAVAARVVAWHNRHPLARRITAAQVSGIGYVALPYGQPVVAGQGGLKAWWAQCKAVLPLLRPSLQAAFTEDFIAPIPLRQVARWAARHGRVLVQAPDDAPVRDVPLSTELQGQASTVYVLSAAVDLGTLRTRVLVGAHKGFGTSAAVLGPRLWNGNRLSASAAAVLVLGLGVGLLVAATGWRQELTAGWAAAPVKPNVQAKVITEKAADAGTEIGKAKPALAQLTQAAPAASATAATRAVPPVAAASAPPSSALSQSSAWAASQAAAPQQTAALPPSPPAALKPLIPDVPVLASAPAPTQAQLGRIELPALGGLISEEAKAAARAQRQNKSADKPNNKAGDKAPPAMAAASAPATTTATGGMPSDTLLRTVAQAPAALPSTARAAGRQAVFALTTRPLRTRAEAEQVMVAMGALLRTAAALNKLNAGAKTQTDILPEGEDWRVVGMPFAKRDDAEQARKLLVARGMRVDVVDF